ncbi:MAG TPA: hypothetical protein VF614_00935, partial [Chthoniobacteraceae bacterium]
MKKRLLLPALLFIATVAYAEHEIGFIEKFALAADREAVLTELLPGSEEFYFFHALHYQNTKQEAKLAATLDQWTKRFPDSAQRRIIKNRAALLRYDADPQATLTFLRERLNLRLDHQREAIDQKPNLPSVLDPVRISRAVFQQHLLRNSSDLSGASEEALRQLVFDKVQLTQAQQRALLAKLSRPDLPSLTELVEADLRSTDSKGFGEFGIHRQLLPDQLDALSKRLPALLDHQPFVFTRLLKLAPNADVDPEIQPAEREAWLERLWTYAKNLSPVFNTLKAHILFARLQHDRTQGIYDKARFLEYLKLPRRTGYMNPAYLEPSARSGLTGVEMRTRLGLVAYPVDLQADLNEVLGTSTPIHDDEWLVREYLIELFKTEPAWEPFAVYLREDWAKALFAEAKMLHGIGNAEQWASLLPAAQFQQIKDRVEVVFASANPPVLRPADVVALDLWLKNTPKVLVKIYEVNTLNFFLTEKRTLNTDLKLDGLVANVEKTHDFSAEPAARNPYRRIPRRFEFPELKGRRGAWIVEFIGGGTSSRALIRKGEYHVLPEITAAGDALLVLDEEFKPVTGAAAWVDGRRFAMDEKSGRIIVPFTAQQAEKQIVISDAAGEFATLANITHHSEQYELDARFHVEREQLLAGRKATLAIRTALRVHGHAVPIGLLEEPRLTLTATTLDGISSTEEISDLKLDDTNLFTHEFTVPERLNTLTATLTAKMPRMAGEKKKDDLTASSSWSVNGIDLTEATSEGRFTRVGENLLFELLGKNGEPVPHRGVQFTFFHAQFTDSQIFSLATDERGRINLGTLPEMRRVDAMTTFGRYTHFEASPAIVRPSKINARVGETIRTPANGAPGKLTSADVALLEQRGELTLRNHTATVAVANGFIEIANLPPGDYTLHVGGAHRESIAISVSAGARAASWLLSGSRHLEANNPAPLQISELEAGEGALRVKILNADTRTRITVAATRFVPDMNLLQWLTTTYQPSPSSIIPPYQPNLFANSRVLGDEFRYILERRAGKTFPGNMLARPGLLLNPWELRSTELLAQSMQGGEVETRAAGGRESKSSVAESVAGEPSFDSIQPTRSAGPNLDFLATAAPVIFNLIPDADGIVSVDRKLLGDRHHVQIYADNGETAILREFAFPAATAEFRDVRLSRNLDPQNHFSPQREIALLGKGQSLIFEDRLTSDLQTYDSLATVHALFTTLSGDARLAKFAWVLQWPKLSDEEKRLRYSEFSSHELNVFLWRKDPPFFKAVVQPYVANKKEKAFIDDFLLEADLTRYLEPWAYGRLNVAERALLGRRLPHETAKTARHLRELNELIAPDNVRQGKLFETALRGRSLGAQANEFAALAEELAGAKSELAQRAASPSPAAAALDGTRREDAADSGPQDAAENSPPGRAKVSARMARSAPAKELGAFPQRQLGLDNTARLRKSVRALFRALGPTKEWAENQYYELPRATQTPDLVKINGFWRDYAAWNGEAPFLSKHIAEATGSFTEMMLALALLDLPFSAEKAVTTVEQSRFTYTASGPVIAFHQQIRHSELAQGEAQFAVTEQFYRTDERHRVEGNETYERYVTGEFLAGVVYGANVVVSNPTATPQSVELLLQIPRGALPVLGSKPTPMERVRLEPYSTRKFGYSFYFPSPSPEPLPHFPAQLTQGEKVLGAAKPFSFKVVRQLSAIDTTSWQHISQHGTEAEVFAFLEKENLQRVDLGRVAWRARESVAFFQKLTALLAARHIYHDAIYSYAVLHNDPERLTEWLRHQKTLIAESGPFLVSKLLSIDPIERRAYEHLEYTPLVNQRIHRLGAEPRIANPVLREHYQSLLRILAHKPALDPVDQMSVVYYLFLQDRVEEALGRFAAVDPAALPMRLQHDYFRCYAAFYEERLTDARTIATNYATHPVERWRKLFHGVASQLDEIEGKAAPQGADPQRDAAAVAETEPAFEFKVENRKIALTWKNLSTLTVNYYLMDPEFLFSSSPFASEDPARFAIIKPTKGLQQALPAGQSALELPLPAEFARANVLVEILAAGKRQAQAYHANSLRMAFVESYGRLEARDEVNNRPA